MQAGELDRIAAELLGLLGAGRQVPPVTARHPDFGLTEAYAVAGRLRTLRAARGERVVGRKIGFTNRAVWGAHGIAAPIWHVMFDGTVRDLPGAGGTFVLAGLPEPRIEPEIVLGLSRAPEPGMDVGALFDCVDWVAHGIEVVSSIFPGWRFTAADAAAAYGVHAGLLIGPRHGVAADRAAWRHALSTFRIALLRPEGGRLEGEAANVLGGPLEALRFLVEEIARYPGSPALEAGEVVTTGTLTEAMPARPGETWRTELEGIALPGLRLSFV